MNQIYLHTYEYTCTPTNIYTEDEMVGWHHGLNGHKFEQAPGDGEGQDKPGVLQSMGVTKGQT